jgi:ribosomal protein S18 acetylase RimI-like enzyme
MTPAFRLRPVAAGDRAFLAAVYASTRMEELAATDWTDAQKADFCEMQFTAQDAHYRQHYLTADFQVIEIEGTPAGRLYVDRWENEIRIMDIALLPRYRGKGVGTRLLLELQQEAAGCGKILSIHVERFNPALRLYERLGFRMAEDKGVYLLLERAVT